MIKEVGPLDGHFESHYKVSDDETFDQSEYIGFYRPADTVEHAGEDYLYQILEWKDIRDIPEDEIGSSNVEQYVDELNTLYDEHQKGFTDLIEFDFFSVGIELHGQAVGDYEGETWAEARPIPRSEMFDIMKELTEQTELQTFSPNQVLHPNLPHTLSSWDIVTEDRIIHCRFDEEDEITYLDEPEE